MFKNQILHVSLLFLLISFCNVVNALGGDAKWNYVVTYVDNDTNPHLDIHVSFKNAKSDVTRFYLPRTDMLMETCAIRNLRSSSGHRIVPVHEKCAFDVYHQAGEDIELEYQVLSHSVNELFSLHTPFSALITEKYFYFVGGNVFLGIAASSLATEYEITWNMPSKNHVISTVHGNNNRQKFISQQNDLLKNVYVGGFISKVRLEKDRYLTFVDLDKGYEKDMITFWKDVLRYTKALWQDPMNSRYNVNMIFLNRKNIPENQAIGVGFKQSVGILDYNVQNPTHDTDFLVVLIHEMLHRWIGGYIDIQNTLWFSEGVTEFYARNLELLRSSDLEHYINWHNKALRHYHTLSHSGGFNTRNVENFTNLMGPYIYGYLLASDFNYQFKEHSDRKSSLLDVVRDLYRKSKLSNKDLTIQDFIESGENYWPQFVNYFNEVMLGLKYVSGKDGELGVCAKLVHKKYHTAEYELDHIAAMNEMVIKGLKSKSSLYNMGLRNGQKVEHFEILDENISDLPISLVVSTSIGSQEFVIRRHGRLVSVPQYELNTALYKSNPKKCLDYFKQY